MRQGSALVLCALAALDACHGSSDQAPVSDAAPRARSSAPAKRGLSPQQQTRGMVEAARMGSSQLPVSVKFEMSQRPALGQAMDVNIAVLPQIAAAPASIRVSGSEGLSLSPATAQLDLPAVDPSEVYRHTVTITPTADGFQTMSVTVTLHHEDADESRVFTVPVLVGAAEAAAAAPVAAKP